MVKKELTLTEIYDEIDDTIVGELLEWDNPLHALKEAYLRGKQEKSKKGITFTLEERQTILNAIIHEENSLRKELSFGKAHYFDEDEYKRKSVLLRRTKRLGFKLLDSLPKTEVIKVKL